MERELPALPDRRPALRNLAEAAVNNTENKKMKSNVVVLRSTSLATRDVLRGSAAASAGSAIAGVAAELKTLDRNQIPVLTRDASVLAVAPAMRMKLIEPLDKHAVTAAAADITWGVRAVGADTSPQTGEGIVVAVLDTGIDASHPAFAGVELVQRDFTGEGNGDGHGHGTHCAGTIFGRKVNGVRIGVAPGIRKALIGKVLGNDSGGSSDQLAKAILWAIDEGADVISMSLGIDFTGWVEHMVNVEHMPPGLATARALEDYRANTMLFGSWLWPKLAEWFGVERRPDSTGQCSHWKRRWRTTMRCGARSRSAIALPSPTWTAWPRPGTRTSTLAGRSR